LIIYEVVIIIRLWIDMILDMNIISIIISVNNYYNSRLIIAKIVLHFCSDLRPQSDLPPPLMTTSLFGHSQTYPLPPTWQPLFSVTVWRTPLHVTTPLLGHSLTYPPPPHVSTPLVGNSLSFLELLTHMDSVKRHAWTIIINFITVIVIIY